MTRIRIKAKTRIKRKRKRRIRGNAPLHLRRRTKIKINNNRRIATDLMQVLRRSGNQMGDTVNTPKQNQFLGGSFHLKA
jgi:hypothetical protein